ncbi:MAG: hypothetical protein L0Z50_23505 [Verrucomicrobiales bacterium]|nr:hypothetical protein [Verrucomicrobiales bacterium]
MSETNDRFSDDFAKAIEGWRRKYHLREDEPLLLCLELFRIHQEHWDDLRRKEYPSFSEFRDSMIALQQQSNSIQRHEASLLEELRRYPKPSRFVAPTLAGLILTALFSAITGVLIGKFLL